MKLILVALLSLSAMANSQTYKLNSDVCTKLKSVYDTVCPPVTCIATANGKCSFIESSPTGDITYAQGVALCAEQGGTPGNIYSKAHYDTIYNKMREIAGTKDGQYYVWLGMKYSSSTSTNAVLTDGSAAPYTKWHAGYPSGAYGASQITLVAKTSSTTSQYMHCWKAAGGNGTRRGILCEKAA